MVEIALDRFEKTIQEFEQVLAVLIVRYRTVLSQSPAGDRCPSCRPDTLYRKNWPLTAMRQSETRDRDDQCRDHDNGEAWVPSSENVKKGHYFCWLHDLRDEQAPAKYQPAN
jgi:hypothetical protein